MMTATPASKMICPNCHALTPTYRGRNKRRCQIPPLDEIQRGIAECGSVAEYAARIGVSKDATVRQFANLADIVQEDSHQQEIAIHAGI